MSEQKTQSEQTNKVEVENGLSSKYLGFTKKVRNMSGILVPEAYEKDVRNVTNVYTAKKEQQGFGRY